MKSNSAFTLLELIVAIAIVVLLAGVVAPLVKSSFDDAKIAKVLQLVDTLRTAGRKYHADTGYYPVETPAGGTLFAITIPTPPGALSSTWRGPYIDQVLTKSNLNPWGDKVEVHDVLIGSVPGDSKYVISGESFSGAGSELHLNGIPEEMAQKIDVAIDGGPFDPVQSLITGRCEMTRGVGTPKVCNVWIYLFK